MPSYYSPVIRNILHQRPPQRPLSNEVYPAAPSSLLLLYATPAVLSPLRSQRVRLFQVCYNLRTADYVPRPISQETIERGHLLCSS